MRAIVVAIVAVLVITVVGDNGAKRKCPDKVNDLKTKVKDELSDCNKAKNNPDKNKYKPKLELGKIMKWNNKLRKDCGPKGLVNQVKNLIGKLRECRKARSDTVGSDLQKLIVGVTNGSVDAGNHIGIDHAVGKLSTVFPVLESFVEIVLSRISSLIFSEPVRDLY